MRSVTVRLDDLRTTVLNLGFVGENEHTQIRIDSKKMFDQYPTASASLTVCPPVGESYPAVIERDGDFVLWTITDSDLVSEGSGEIQLSFTVSETVAKSYIGRFKVSRSIIPTGEIPSGLDDFLTRASAALTAIPETIDESLAEAKASGEFDGPAGPAGADGAPGRDGTDGQDGFSPTATVIKSGKTATITITDKNGTTTAQISDGEGGDLIDDTQKSATSTYSSNKIEDELDVVKTEINSKMDEPETEGTAGQFLQTDGNGGRTWATPSGGGGTSDYSDLTNKPQINGVTLSGNKTSADLGIGVVETVSGSTPSITGVADHRYICGEVATLTITAPASGIIDVVFKSGSTPTVLTVSSSIKWANGFDPSSLDANTTYELNILDGEYGVSCSWT